MALYKVDVEKFKDGEYWTNRYILSSTTLENAVEGSDIIVEGERAFHRTGVAFTKVRVSSAVENDLVYSSRPLTNSGLLEDSGPYLPLFNVIRADFPVEGGGRPSRKYYRMGICAGDVVVDYQVSSSLVILMESELTAMLAALGGNASPLVDPQTQEIDGVAVFDRIAMRQLRKGSRRRTEPIL
jgi:hypothetical protein